MNKKLAIMSKLVIFALLICACQAQPEMISAPMMVATHTISGSMVFADEFDGNTLNVEKWATEYVWGRANPPELQYYTKDAFVVKNGILTIQAEDQPTEGMAYSSGVITSYDHFQFTYGYVEANIRIPAGQGLWPALWLLDAGGSADEIDIVEFLGHTPTLAYMTLHYADSSGNQIGTADGKYDGPNFAGGFHTVAVDWQPTAVTWYVDGVERYQVTKEIPAAPMYLIANLAVGGDWPGPPNASTHFPAAYQIDYIRVFQ